MVKADKILRKTMVVLQNGCRYRIFCDDLRKVFQVKRKKFPPPPKYDDFLE